MLVRSICKTLVVHEKNNQQLRLMYTCACLYNTISIICSNYYFYSIPLNHQPPHQNFNQLAKSILILVKTNNFINSMNGEGKLSTAKQTKCYSRKTIPQELTACAYVIFILWKAKSNFGAVEKDIDAIHIMCLS